GFRRMEAFLAPSAMGSLARAYALRALHVAESNPGRYDFVLCEPGIPVPRNGYLFESDDSESLANLIVAENPQLELALARTFPLFRKAVADRIIHRTARENALFSLVTALPNVIPSFIELPWTLGEFATDTAFLTMNQIRMAMKMAAAHGQPVGYAEQKVAFAAILAGAFGWRAIARELVGKIPLGGGLIPKAAVAFAGTWVVGLGLDKVHRTGSGLTREEKREAYATAFLNGKEIARELAPGLQGGEGGQQG
ncbi:MAG: hypothetical protein ABUS49_05765, partial [Acidobacteriota bacterium]